MGHFEPVLAELPTTIWKGKAEALKGDEFFDAIPAIGSQWLLGARRIDGLVPFSRRANWQSWERG